MSGSVVITEDIESQGDSLLSDCRETGETDSDTYTVLG
jgi:hypothetical protein